jgi:hypothetical protein
VEKPGKHCIWQEIKVHIASNGPCCILYPLGKINLCGGVSKICKPWNILVLEIQTFGAGWDEQCIPRGAWNTKRSPSLKHVITINVFILLNAEKHLEAFPIKWKGCHVVLHLLPLETWSLRSYIHYRLITNIKDWDHINYLPWICTTDTYNSFHLILTFLPHWLPILWFNSHYAVSVMTLWRHVANNYFWRA